MSDVFRIQLPDGRIVGVEASSPEEAAAGARNIVARETGGQPQGRSDAVGSAIGRGATLGFGDELTAAVRAAMPEFSNWMMRGPALQRDPSIGGSPTPQTVSTAPTYGQRYEEELTRTRAQAEADRRQYPYLVPGAEFAGSVATSALALPSSATAAAPTLLGNIGKMAATGATLGGIQGFAEGEGGLENRIGKGLVTGAIGGTVGAAMPVVGAIGRQIVERVPALNRALARITGNTQTPVEKGAIDRLSVAMQRSGMTQPQATARVGELGDDFVLADLNQNLMSEARRARTLPGQTRDIASTNLVARDREAGTRLARAFEGRTPPPSSVELRGDEGAFNAFARAVGQQAYQGDMVAAGLKQPKALREMLDNPLVDAAIKRVMAAESATRAGTSRPPASPVEIMHKVKQEIWNLGFDKETARPGPLMSWYRDLGTRFVDELKRANPALAEADRRYAHAKSLPEFFDVGAGLLRRSSMTEQGIEQSAPALTKSLANADPMQRAAAAAGATNVARDQALESTRLARALANRISESGPVQQKLRAIYDAPTANRIINQAGAEGTFAQTSNDILRGSQTADKLAEAADVQAIGSLLPTSWSPQALLQWLGAAPQVLMRPGEPVRNTIGRMTLSRDPAENQRLLELIYANMLKRNAGSPLAAAIAGSVGGAAGR